MTLCFQHTVCNTLYHRNWWNGIQGH